MLEHIWLFRKRIIGFSDNVRFIYNIYILSWLISIYTVGFLVVWFRVYVLTFMFTFWILIPVLIKSIRWDFKIFFLLAFLILTSSRVIYTINKFPYLEYKNILFQQDSYDERKYIVDEFDKERGLG